MAHCIMFTHLFVSSIWFLESSSGHNSFICSNIRNCIYLRAVCRKDCKEAGHCRIPCANYRWKAPKMDYRYNGTPCPRGGSTLLRLPKLRRRVSQLQVFFLLL